jgi:hypothetical protein
MIKELSKFWESQFGVFPPEAHKLKHEYKNRWVRFHSLPESKRYPENELEYLEVIRRHNVVLRELCGDEGMLLVVLPEYSESKLATKPSTKLAGLFPVTEPWCSLRRHEEGDDYKLYWHLHVAEVQIDANELNSLFRLVANDEAGNIMVINTGKSIVYHPYDGGADVVLASTEQRDQLKEKHSGWLSSHPEGF